MGQKVNPNLMRLGIIKSWKSLWYGNKKEYLKNIKSDFKIRKYLEKKLFKSLISEIIIHRYKIVIHVIIKAGRPGLIIGKKGKYIEKLSFKIFKIAKIHTKVKIIEHNKPWLDAKLISNNIKLQLEKRISFKRAMTRSIKNSMDSGALGIKIELSGRLGGSEIARTEWYKKGRVPLHTLRANINYDFSEAKTNYGIIGIKVWIFKKEIVNINKYFKKIINKKYF